MLQGSSPAESSVIGKALHLNRIQLEQRIAPAIEGFSACGQRRKCYTGGHQRRTDLRHTSLGDYGYDVMLNEGRGKRGPPTSTEKHVPIGPPAADWDVPCTRWGRVVPDNSDVRIQAVLRSQQVRRRGCSRTGAAWQKHRGIRVEVAVRPRDRDRSEPLIDPQPSPIGQCCVRIDGLAHRTTIVGAQHGFNGRADNGYRARATVSSGESRSQEFLG